MKIAASAGDLGDIIYSLACLKHTGETHDYYLVDRPFTKGWTAERVQALVPLIQKQEYIRDVVWGEPPRVDVDFVNFRKNGIPWGVPLGELHARFAGIERVDWAKPWLKCGSPSSRAKGKVVIARSHRYRSPVFPWKEIFEQVRDRAVFIGLPVEHKDFHNAFGEVPFLETRDLLEVANVLSGCDLFIGNQSSPMAVAEGLKIPRIQEVCLFQPDCLLGGGKVHYGIGEPFEFTVIKGPGWEAPVDIDRSTIPPGGWQYEAANGTSFKGMSFRNAVRFAAGSDLVPEDEAECRVISQTAKRLPGYGAAGWGRTVQAQIAKIKELLESL